MKIFLVIFDILLAAYKKVCDISDKDTKWQEFLESLIANLKKGE